MKRLWLLLLLPVAALAQAPRIAGRAITAPNSALVGGPVARPVNNVRVHADITIGGSASISTSTGQVNFTLKPGQTVPGDQTVTVTTTLNGLSLGLLSSFQVYGWLSSPTAALTNTANPSFAIPASDVLGSVGASSSSGINISVGSSGGSSGYVPFTAIVPSGLNGAGDATGLQLFGGSNLLVISLGVVTLTTPLSLELVTPTNLPAGTYQGTLTIQASIQ